VNAHSPLIGVVIHGPITINLTINAATRERPEPSRPKASEPAAQRVSVGRIVHYHPTDEERRLIAPKSEQPFAALVCGVFGAGDGSDICSLMAFPPGKRGFVVPECRRQGEPGTPGTWSFPSRV
jgi:hypothetical protein